LLAAWPCGDSEHDTHQSSSASEIKSAARQRRFVFLSRAAAVGAVLVVLIYTFNEGRIEEQEGRNRLLTAEIKT
jgi:Tfp pilus assembly protein PilN